MTRVLDIRLPSSGRFDTIRWAEYAVLLAGAAIAVFFYQPYGTLLVGPLALISLMLIPGKPEQASREQQRLKRVHDLHQAGLILRARCLVLAEDPAGLGDTIDLQRAYQEVHHWIAACEEHLDRFPEIGGIFAARIRGGDPIEDLDLCLSMLSRLRRLLSLSDRLKLPI